MDCSDSVAQRKPDRYFRDVGHLIGRSVVVVAAVWFSTPFLCASLHIGGPHWAVLVRERTADAGVLISLLYHACPLAMQAMRKGKA